VIGKLASWESSERWKGESFDFWSEILLEVAESTRSVYMRNMLKFLEFVDMDTDQLFNAQVANLREFEREDGDPRSKARLPRKVKELMRSLKESGLSDQSIIQIGKAVNSFFKANQIEFTLLKYAVRKVGKNGKDKIKKDQIKTLMSYSGNPQTLAMITTLKDTGLRISDLVNIRVKHVRPIIEDQTLQFHTFEIETQKTTGRTGILANPCLGTDSIKYIRLWWVERERFDCGEEENDFLFCKVKDKQPYERTDYRTGEKVLTGGSRRGDPVDSNTISPMFNRLLKKSKLDHLNISAHSFRKFFETELQKSDIPDSFIDKYTGRKHAYKGEYIRPDTEDLLQYYKEAYKWLSLDSDTSHLTEQIERERTRGEILETKIEDIKKDLHYTTQYSESIRAELQDRDQTINELKEQLANLTKLVTEKLNGDPNEL